MVGGVGRPYATSDCSPILLTACHSTNKSSGKSARKINKCLHSRIPPQWREALAALYLKSSSNRREWAALAALMQGIALGGAASESFNNNPRAEQNVFLPGALTSTWTGSTWTADRPVTITRVQVQAKTAPFGCTTNAVVRLTDGTTPVNVTISAAFNDDGAMAQNYATGALLTVAVQTAAAGSTTSPADAKVTVQYRM